MTSASKMERTRYLLVFYIYDRQLKKEELRRIFSNQLNRLYGLKGGLEMGLFLSWVNPDEPIIILRASHRNIKKLFNVTFFITDYNDKILSTIPIKTAGSIKTIKNFALTQNWKDLIPKKQINS